MRSSLRVPFRMITDSRCSDSLAGRPGCLPEDRLEPYYTGLVNLACDDSHIIKRVFERTRDSDFGLFMETLLKKEECAAVKDLPEDWRAQLTERLKRLPPAQPQSSAVDSEGTSP